MQKRHLPVQDSDSRCPPPYGAQTNQRLGGEKGSEITHQIDPSLMVSAATTFDESEDTSIIAGAPVGADPTSGSLRPLP